MSEQPRPLISVIIPAYNAERHLAGTLRNVRAQNYAPLEIIIVNDGSTDGTAALAETMAANDPGIHCISQENQGPAAARNRGISEATGDFLAFIDADDLWPDGKLARQLEVLLQNPQLDMVIGFQQQFLEETPDGSPVLDQEPGFMYLAGCGLYRPRAFETVGLFDPSMRYSEDTDWFLRAWEMDAPMKIQMLPMLYYRRHPGGMTHGRDAVGTGYLKAIKKSLDRRRCSGEKNPKALPWLFKQIPQCKLEEWLESEERRRFALKTKDTRISVIMPVYNREQYVGAAINSILGQTTGTFDIIAVDDGSTDRSSEIIRSYGSKIRYIRQDHAGIVAAINRALELAEGEYIAFLDSDDLWVPRKTEWQLHFMHKNPGIGMVLGHYAEFHGPLPPLRPPRCKGDEGAREGYLQCALLTRRSTFLKIGPYAKPDLGSFIDWFSRAQAQGLKSELVPEVVFYRRVHGGNVTLQQKDQYNDYLRVVKAHLQRQRQKPIQNSQASP